MNITHSPIKESQMHTATEDEIISSNPIANAKSAFADHVEVLEGLLLQSIQLRDLYKAARWQTVDLCFRRLRQLLDVHYQDQVRLVDTLLDRIRALNGCARVFAGVFLDQPRCAQRLRNRASAADLLAGLIDAHESVLNLASPAGAPDSQRGSFWARDFAVGRVVLTNEEQLLAVREQLTQRGLPLQTAPNLD